MKVNLMVKNENFCWMQMSQNFSLNELSQLEKMQKGKIQNRNLYRAGQGRRCPKLSLPIFLNVKKIKNDFQN